VAPNCWNFAARQICGKSLKEEWFGASSSLHARFQVWRQAGLCERIFRLLVLYDQQRKHIQWRWQAIDSKSV